MIEIKITAVDNGFVTTSGDGVFIYDRASEAFADMAREVGAYDLQAAILEWGKKDKREAKKRAKRLAKRRAEWEACG